MLVVTHYYYFHFVKYFSLYKHYIALKLNSQFTVHVMVAFTTVMPHPNRISAGHNIHNAPKSIDKKARSSTRRGAACVRIPDSSFVYSLVYFIVLRMTSVLAAFREIVSMLCLAMRYSTSRNAGCEVTVWSGPMCLRFAPGWDLWMPVKLFVDLQLVSSQCVCSCVSCVDVLLHSPLRMRDGCV